jgi:hypothetical protein
METNELIISRHNRHCLQCRSIAHNVLRLCDVAEKTHLNFKFKTND